MQLPDGSSSRICLPPLPTTTSLRKRAPAAVGHGLAGAAAAAGRAEQQPQLAAGKHRESRRRFHLGFEAEVGGVESHCSVHVVHDVAHAYRCHVQELLAGATAGSAPAGCKNALITAAAAAKRAPTAKAAW